MDAVALQDRYARLSRCFGCGPANERGLRLKSFADRAQGTLLVVAKFLPEAHHESFPAMLNGGIAGALLDCHSNWCAAEHLREEGALEPPPCTVTADFHVTLKRPTPLTWLALEARVVEASADRAIVEATLRPIDGDKVTVTCRGTFVAVKPGHPAYHAW